MDCFLLCAYHFLLVATAEPATVSGFLVQSPQNEWYLVSEPNLKTCCIGKKEKQIHVLNDFPPELHNTFATLTGNLQDNTLVSAQLLPKKKSVPYGTLGVSLFLVLIGLGWYSRRIL